MAAPLRAVLTLGKSTCSLLILTETYGCTRSRICSALAPVLQLKLSNPQTQPVRTYPSFINRTSGQQLWEGVTGVSNAGKKRGRGKRVGRKRQTDLNRGQVIGTGKANMQWSGLNAPILKGREVLQTKQLPPDPDRDVNLAAMRDQQSKIRFQRLPPLVRGFTGTRFPGQSIGPPDPVGDYVFHGFDSKVLQFRLVTNMTGTLGRKQRFSAFVVTGNQNGLAGFGIGKGQNGRSALRVAKNRAAHNLFYVPRYENRTVYHDMFTQLHRTKIFIHKKEYGYGLKCHRVLKAICDIVGIQDLHAKVEGSTKNVTALTKAFFNAVANQETHQELADRTRYHIVELKQERDNLPVVLASPQEGDVQNVPMMDEEQDLEVDYQRMYLDGKVEYKRPKRLPFYEYNMFDSWRQKYAERHKARNQPHAKILRDAGLW